MARRRVQKSTLVCVRAKCVTAATQTFAAPVKSISSLTECTLKENPTFREPHKSQPRDYKKGFDKCASDRGPAVLRPLPPRSPAFAPSGRFHLAEMLNLVILYLAPGPRGSIYRRRAATSPVALSADVFSIQMHSNKSFKALAENVIM